MGAVGGRISLVTSSNSTSMQVAAGRPRERKAAHARAGRRAVPAPAARGDVAAGAKRDARRGRTVKVEATDGATVTARETVLDAGSRGRRVIWHWYRVGGDRTASGLAAKLLQFKALASGRKDAAVVAFSTVDIDEEAARARLREFIPAAAVGVASTLEDLRQAAAVE